MAVAEVKPRRQRRERTENAAKRRRQLMEATIESIAARGLAATTLASVADAAGLSQGVAVFYFKTKESLLTETLRYHYEDYDAVWQKALDEAGPDPVDRLTALVLADLDDAICTARNLALWSAFWGETSVRPTFAEVCDTYDRKRTEILDALCAEVADLIEGEDWDASMLAETLDAITDGFWTRMHISPQSLTREGGRRIVAHFLSSLLPSRAKQIQGLAERASSGKRPGQKST